MSTPALLGPIDVLGQGVVGGVTIIEFLLLALVVVNIVIRIATYRNYASVAADVGPEGLSRSLLLEVTTVLIVLGGFYYVTIHLHGGVIFTVLALGLLITDFFEFEARLVEARNDLTIEQPKAALVAASFVFLYIAYQSLFFIIRPFWELVI